MTTATAISEKRQEQIDAIRHLYPQTDRVLTYLAQRVDHFEALVADETNEELLKVWSNYALIGEELFDDSCAKADGRLL